jgi:flavorubredoxin
MYEWEERAKYYYYIRQKQRSQQTFVVVEVISWLDIPPVNIGKKKKKTGEDVMVAKISFSFEPTRCAA